MLYKDLITSVILITTLTFNAIAQSDKLQDYNHLSGRFFANNSAVTESESDKVCDISSVVSDFNLNNSYAIDLR